MLLLTMKRDSPEESCRIDFEKFKEIVQEKMIEEIDQD